MGNRGFKSGSLVSKRESIRDMIFFDKYVSKNYNAHDQLITKYLVQNQPAVRILFQKDSLKVYLHSFAHCVLLPNTYFRADTETQLIYKSSSYALGKNQISNKLTSQHTYIYAMKLIKYISSLYVSCQNLKTNAIEQLNKLKMRLVSPQHLLYTQEVDSI